jgi:hypothetical protein
MRAVWRISLRRGLMEGLILMITKQNVEAWRRGKVPYLELHFPG